MMLQLGIFIFLPLRASPTSHNQRAETYSKFPKLGYLFLLGFKVELNSDVLERFLIYTFDMGNLLKTLDASWRMPLIWRLGVVFHALIRVHL
jgi:hypothetical protein